MSKKASKADAAAQPKALAVASFGGHLVQLVRIMEPLRNRCRVAYVSTSAKAKDVAFEPAPFYVVSDFSRSTPWRLASSFVSLFKIMRRERPDVVVSTGAAPGLSAIVIGKLLGIRTLWVDSIANADKLSLCGRIASKIATETITQWPHLATGNVHYRGTTL